ncbi:MAG: hypothetical protein EOP47_04085 [Sphingobacteriaceae bacterium]|nr:MAG: hypothetical protein EOP47_04085 [Sphingobacteriaceae bacterium]
MTLNSINDKQKSLKRRFLLILGIVTLVCIIGLGLMLMFWQDIPVQLTNTQRKLFGGLIILYGILRFSRLLKKDDE